MKIFEKCPPEVDELLEEVVSKVHPRLREAEVTFGCVFARNEDEKGNIKPAVKRHGVPASAMIAITSAEDRTRGLEDAKLTIDAHIWNRMKPDERRALLDHELTHIIVDGEETDDLGRPKLKSRPHDWEIWGFAEIVQRHGRNAPEFRAAEKLMEDYGQLLLWPKPTAGAGRVTMKPDKENGKGADA